MNTSLSSGTSSTGKHGQPGAWLMVDTDPQARTVRLPNGIFKGDPTEQIPLAKILMIIVENISCLKKIVRKISYIRGFGGTTL